MPRPEKKQSNGLFVSNVDNEQAVRDLFPEEDKAKIIKLDKWGKYNHVVMFTTVEEAKAALDRQPPEHKKPTPPGQPRKPNIKFFEDRGSHRGNAGTWQSSNRGGNTSQRGYQSGGASDSEGGRGRGGFSGRGRGRGDRGRGGRGGRGGFNKGGPTSDSPAPSTSTPSGEKPTAAGDA
ncbi:Ser/Thr protein phosphatase family protein [Aspergillus nomiae NRRL 13137]|nr:Ser/Thr protein phosphatase family protein [Aspergillus nomiae NRRL 13137]KNG82790.1 Ser/Thr protein phosphatase family protein [Aspergillus nomiae NRRL 13137]